MVELIAKLKSEYKNVLSQVDDIIPNLDLTEIEQIDFTTSHKLEDDEWFKITNFTNKNFFINECNRCFSTVSLHQISNGDYKDIEGIAILQQNQILFQRITPSLYIRQKTFLDYSDDPKIVKQRNQIEIREEADAAYVYDDDTLYFKSISKIKILFPGIEVLQREATQQEVNNFMDNDFISSSSFDSTLVGVQNRKRIADIGTKYLNLSEDKQQRLIIYAREKTGINLENDKFEIKNDNDLKSLLYAIDQRYYYADIYEENRIGNRGFIA